MLIVPALDRRHSILFLEYFIEIAPVFKADPLHDGTNRLICGQQHLMGILDSCQTDISGRVHIGDGFDLPVQLGPAHTHQIGKSLGIELGI